ncbi:predicted protein [Naegleria gruberi]|uniref:Predicted protein n=1 Tax=Naegleria gruberi TaxID=5762 RepID=D2VND5_NAEGR|nr:uncharacterized protein NAEGRDRAFT_70457 [Naegleria gruberi]EFC41718.1 predicted protein [Naegleria gruberi]|eukprot:XP_002674462.1 predicted protein [Naegleria gruberi strain NEG-M]
MSSTRERLDQARSNVQKLERHGFNEMMSFCRPPAKLPIMFSLVMILLESKKNIATEEEGLYDWKDIMRELTGSVDIRSRIVAIESVSKETLEKATIFVNNHQGILENSYGNISMVAEKLCSWVDALLAHSKQ